METNRGMTPGQIKRSEWFILLFPLLIIIYEVLFGIVTGGEFTVLSLLFTLLFSISIGLIFYLASTLFTNYIVNHVISCVFILILAIPYLVEYFIFRQFKVLYDLNTMTGGASDALTSYTAELMLLLKSPQGIVTLFVYLLPTVIFAATGWKLLPAAYAPSHKKMIGLCGVLLAFLVGHSAVIHHSVYNNIYDAEYNFQSSVRSFGLLTGLRLDLQAKMAPEEDFEYVPPPETTEPSTEPSTQPTGGSTAPSTEPTEPPKVFGYNEMDIDFDALIAGSNGAIKQLHQYVQSQTPSKENEYTGLFAGKNLIFLTAEAFSAELIDPVLTPTLYRLATKGIQFTDYYQPASAGTTGGEYQNIFGMMPSRGGKSFKMTADHLNYFTMGNQLNRLGYYGKAYHNNSYTYYSRHETHINLGYSDGYMGYGNGIEEYVTRNWPQSDYEMIAGTLPTYIDKEHFNIYYMTVSGHSGYTTGGNSMTRRHWARVQDLPYSDLLKGYFAANLDLEDALTHLVYELEKKGIADDTVICISADHFPYGLDSDAPLGQLFYLSELYGYEVTDYLSRDHSRLILWCGSLEDQEPIVVDTPTFSLDIIPTLSNLFGLEYDSRLLPGRDVFSDQEALVFNMSYDWKTELGTYISAKGQFIPAEEGIEVTSEYIQRIKAIVRNKLKYCQGVLDNDYFRYLFE